MNLYTAPQKNEKSQVHRIFRQTKMSLEKTLFENLTLVKVVEPIQVKSAPRHTPFIKLELSPLMVCH